MLYWQPHRLHLFHPMTLWAVTGRLSLSAMALVPSPKFSQSKHHEGTFPFHHHRPGKLTRTSGSQMRPFQYGSLCWIWNHEGYHLTIFSALFSNGLEKPRETLNQRISKPRNQQQRHPSIIWPLFKGMSAGSSRSCTSATHKAVNSKEAVKVKNSKEDLLTCRLCVCLDMHSCVCCLCILSITESGYMALVSVPVLTNLLPTPGPLY